MTERKWTEGPWFVTHLKGERAQGFASVAATDDELRYVARCRDTMNLSPTNNEANAHLIAAAPDMYEALEVAASILQRALEDPSWRTNDNTLWPDMCEASRQARAALAKAQGEDQ